jgi:hypothetical protein
MMDTTGGWFVNGMIAVLVIIYTVSYWLPEHYGVKCTPTNSPLGSVLLCVFYIIWTIFTVYHIKNDPLLKIKETSTKSLFRTASDLCLKEYEGEYDHHGMILA